MARRALDQMQRIQALREAALASPPTAHQDYLAFLTSLYQGACERLGTYPFRKLSDDLELGKGNAFWLILKGRRIPSPATLERIAHICSLPSTERHYLQHLRELIDCKTPAERDETLTRMLAIQRSVSGDERARLEQDFLSDWLHSIVFEMVGLKEFRSDPHWICSRLSFEVAPSKVQESLALLEHLGCILFDEETERHVKVITDFETHSRVPGFGVVRFHEKMLDLARESIHSVATEDRELGALTLGLTREGMQKLREEVVAFRRYLLFLAARYSSGDEIMQINFQAFPITKKREGES